MLKPSSSRRVEILFPEMHALYLTTFPRCKYFFFANIRSRYVSGHLTTSVSARYRSLLQLGLWEALLVSKNAAFSNACQR
jgi:hypothetical protein